MLFTIYNLTIYNLFTIGTLYLLKERVEIGHGAEEEDNGYDDNHCTNNLVDDADAALVKDGASLINQPCQSVPPQQGSANNTGKAYEHFYRTVGNNKGKLGKKTHKEEDDERVGERH